MPLPQFQIEIQDGNIELTLFNSNYPKLNFPDPLKFGSAMDGLIVRHDSGTGHILRMLGKKNCIGYLWELHVN